MAIIYFCKLLFCFYSKIYILFKSCPSAWHNSLSLFPTFFWWQIYILTTQKQRRLVTSQFITPRGSAPNMTWMKNVLQFISFSNLVVSKYIIVSYLDCKLYSVYCIPKIHFLSVTAHHNWMKANKQKTKQIDICNFRLERTIWFILCCISI